VSISPLIERFAALLLLAGAIVLVWVVAVGPALDGIAADRAAIDRSNRLLARYREAEAELPLLERQLSELQSAKPAAAAFLEGSSMAMLTARLQSDVQRIITASGLVLRSSRTLPPHEEQGISSVGMQFELGTTASGLRYRDRDACPLCQPVIGSGTGKWCCAA
jgi:hypothetical protein